MDIIAGTAGHIDHGKTALVRALTGVDADRFPEEKQRGITIDIGFAELALGDLGIGFVDVPGHERFVKNMLAGASGIDLVLLVIAADEGVMPQTREHFEICRLLGTRAGIVVVTKTDLVDDELLELVTIEAGELVEGSFLEHAPVIPVSARTGAGLGALKSALSEVGRSVPQRSSENIARLPIDRSFSVKGFGAVVTGTLASGTITEGDEMEILPAGRTVRVRGLQTHGKPVRSAHQGQRTAVNLGGIDHSDVARGMTLAERGALRPTQIVDAEIEVLKTAPRPVRSRQRVRVHLGTVEALARVQVLNENGEIAPGAADLVQLRLESPVACVPGERFILRFYSPQTTIAGGSVLDNSAVRHRRRDVAEIRGRLQRMATGDAESRLRATLDTAGEAGLSVGDLRARTGWNARTLNGALAPLIEKRAVVAIDQVRIARTPFESLKAKAIDAIAAFHKREPLARGIPRETLRERVFARLGAEIFRAVIADVEREGKVVADAEHVRLAAHGPELSEAEKKVRERLSSVFATAGLEVPRLDDALADVSKESGLDRARVRRVFQLLVDAGEVVKITDEFYFPATALAALVTRVRERAAGSADRLIDVAAFKDLAGISRKYAIPLLEYFDRERVTRRAGEKRIVLEERR